MTESKTENYLEILKSFRYAMLTTRNDTGLRSRPMAVAEVNEDDGSVWFLTSIDSGKLDEITEHPEVNLSFQDGTRFLSITGTTIVSRSRERRDELWSPAHTVWFPEGKDDPSLLVLGVLPGKAEYWDNSGVKGIRVIFELGKSVVTGETPEFDEQVNAKISFS